MGGLTACGRASPFPRGNLTLTGCTSRRKALPGLGASRVWTHDWGGLTGGTSQEVSRQQLKMVSVSRSDLTASPDPGPPRAAGLLPSHPSEDLAPSESGVPSGRAPVLSAGRSALILRPVHRSGLSQERHPPAWMHSTTMAAPLEDV